MTAVVTVLDFGPSATVQDNGRIGSAHLGVPRSGAADRAGHHLANRLVGNPESAATIEVLLGGFSCVLSEGRWCSVAGTDLSVTVDGRAVHSRALFYAPAGATVTLGSASFGVRAYLAIAGGVLGESRLGSVSWDSLSQFGTLPAKAGTFWQLGPQNSSTLGVELNLRRRCRRDRRHVRLGPTPRSSHSRGAQRPHRRSMAGVVRD